MALSLRLFGAPSIRYRDAHIDLPSGRVAALLCYLAYRGVWVDREEVAALLWPDSPETRARSNLRKTLSRARELPWATSLEADRSRLRWRVDTDVEAFRSAVDEGRLADALQLYSGKLLERATPDDLPEVRRWLEDERATLHLRWRNAALARVAQLEANGGAANDEAARSLLRQVLDDDPLDEEAVQAYLRLAGGGRDRPDALERYERFRDRLGADLALSPLATTVTLAADVRDAPERAAGTPMPADTPAREVLTTAAVAAAAPPLPRELTPFVSRPETLAAIQATLDDPACRLLTLVGQGGAGKTRLALRTLHERQHLYVDGARAVRLTEAETLPELIAAVAAGVGLQAAGSDVETQLLRWLSDKTMLLLLDDLDRLTDHAAWLATLMQRAPGVQLLATSREALRLHSEWLHEVRGLPYPTAVDDPDPERWAALRLFQQTAERLGVTMDARDALAAARICRRVEGAPLAIELAASWVRVLSVDDIAAELERDLDFLESADRGPLERHRSIRAVFDGSWRRLSPSQQRVLAGLAVFRGGFERQAAATVVDASPRDLLELVSKSLLRRRDSGRFDLHSLVRHYAQIKLTEHDRGDTLLRRHAETYLRTLELHARELKGASQVAALELLQRELDNVVAAWRHAVASGWNEAVTASAHPLFLTYTVANRYREGAEVFRDASERLAQSGAARTLARVRARSGALLARIGDFEEAGRILETCLESDPPEGERAFCLETLGAYVAYWLGDLETARARVTEAHRYYLANSDHHGVARTLFQLGVFAWHDGHYDEARRSLVESLNAFRTCGDLRWEGTCRSTLGVVVYETGDLAQAERLLRQGIERLELARQEQQVATSRSHLGMVIAAQGMHRESLAYYHDALATVERLGDKPWWLPEMLFHLGQAQLQLGEPGAASAAFRRSLDAALELHAKGPTLRALLGFADVLAAANRDDAVALYQYVAEHDATAHADADQARHRLRELSPTEAELGRARARLANEALEPLARRLLRDAPLPEVEQSGR